MESRPPGILTFARLVIDALETAAVEYMLGGSLALYAWGEPRTTRNCDVVVDMPGTRIRALSAELTARRMLVPPEILLDLLLMPEGDLPVNAIHLDSGYKAELFLLRPGDSFRATALARRRLVALGPPLGAVYVHAPEDLILNKVHYYSLSQQTKHVRDIASMLAISGEEIDWLYFQKWVERLGLGAIWQEIKEAADSHL